METTIVNEQIIICKQTMSYVLLFVVYRLLFNFVEIMNLDVKLPSFLCLSGKLNSFHYIVKYMRVSNLLSNTIRLAFFCKNASWDC